MIILGERHLKRVLSSYVDYYHIARTHLSLEEEAPDGRVVQPIEKGSVVELKQVGGLHHLYARMAARRARRLNRRDRQGTCARYKIMITFLWRPSG